MPRRYAALKVVTAPVLEPVSVAEAKAQCRVLHPDDDTYFDTAIKVAREWAEDYTRRAFITQTLDVQYCDWPKMLNQFGSVVDATFLLPRPPLLTVASFKYYDNTDTLVTLDPSNYNVDLIQDPGTVRVKQTLTGGNVCGFPALSKNYVNPITLRITAGYSADGSLTPARVKQAILILIADVYNRRTSVEIDPRLVMVEVPRAAAELLDPLRLRMV